MNEEDPRADDAVLIAQAFRKVLLDNDLDFATTMVVMQLATALALADLTKANKATKKQCELAFDTIGKGLKSNYDDLTAQKPTIIQ